jgi:hypothetical protein
LRDLARGYREGGALPPIARQTPDRQIPEKLIELAREFDEPAAEIEKIAERNSP